MVTLTEFEFGQLSPEAQKAHLAREEKLVFGMKDDGTPSFKRDENGVPISNGIGSRGRETKNHFQWILIREKQGEEPVGAFERAIAEYRERGPAEAAKLRAWGW